MCVIVINRMGSTFGWASKLEFSEARFIKVLKITIIYSVSRMSLNIARSRDFKVPTPTPSARNVLMSSTLVIWSDFTRLQILISI